MVTDTVLGRAGVRSAKVMVVLVAMNADGRTTLPTCTYKPYTLFATWLRNNCVSSFSTNLLTGTDHGGHVLPACG